MMSKCNVCAKDKLKDKNGEYFPIVMFFSSQAQQAQKFREQQEELRRRHIDELRSKDMDRRAQVERHHHIHFYLFYL